MGKRWDLCQHVQLLNSAPAGLFVKAAQRFGVVLADVGEVFDGVEMDDVESVHAATELFKQPNVGTRPEAGLGPVLANCRAKVWQFSKCFNLL